MTKDERDTLQRKKIEERLTSIHAKLDAMKKATGWPHMIGARVPGDLADPVMKKIDALMQNLNSLWVMVACRREPYDRSEDKLAYWERHVRN